MSALFISLLEKNKWAMSNEEAQALYDSMPSSYKNWVKKDVFVTFFSTNGRETIFWHDYEAGGTDAKSVAPMQFAGIRTTLDLEFIDEPCDWYCQLSGDRLPHPVAIAITKINVLKDCQEKGKPEPLFFRSIHAELSVPGTCVTGYNSLAYDDEVTRFGFWRNLLPPYAYAFENGNSRWDLLNVVAAYRAFSPESIKWPHHEDGRVSLKLEDIARENAITQENAHNAMDDVIALVGVSQLLQRANQELWKFLWDRRSKKSVKHMFYPASIGHMSSSSFGADDNYYSPVMILGSVPGDANKYVFVRLDKLDVLRSAYKESPDNLKAQLFSKKDELEAQGKERLPIGTVAINKCPVFIRENEGPGDSIPEDLKVAASRLMNAKGFVGVLMGLFEREFENDQQSAEVSLYSSGFPCDEDALQISKLSKLSVFDAFSVHPQFVNPVYTELWTAARGKLDGHDGISLTPEQKGQFIGYCKARRDTRLSTEKHEEVSSLDVLGVLDETDMDSSLREDYKKWFMSLA